MSTQGKTRQDFITWVSKNEPQAFKTLGEQKFEYWANSLWPALVSRMHEQEYSLWLQSGDTEQLRNRLRFSAGLPAVGTGTAEDFTGAKQRLGDQYRQYLSIAQNILTMSKNELADLQSQLAGATDANAKIVLQSEIQVQNATIQAQTANVATWQKTVNDAIASGQAS